MSSTRDFTSLGVWAENANTTIPPVPVDGTAYRNTAYTQLQNEAGDAYNTKPDSANFNQKMYVISSFIDMLDKHGIVGWSDEVDYAEPAVVWASDNKFYVALQASGPSTTPKDPIDSPTYWELFESAATLRRELASQEEGTEGARIVGYTDMTVQEALDSINDSISNINGFQVVYAGYFDGTTGLMIGNGFNVLDNQVVRFGAGQYSATMAETLADNRELLVFVTPDGYLSPDFDDWVAVSYTYQRGYSSPDVTPIPGDPNPNIGIFYFSPNDWEDVENPPPLIDVNFSIIAIKFNIVP
jgi:hypothetical protein